MTENRRGRDGRNSRPSSLRLYRRAFHSGAAAANCCLLNGLPNYASKSEERPLRQRAAWRSLTHGRMVDANNLYDRPALGAAVARKPALAVPGIEKKLGERQPSKGLHTYGAADAIGVFALQNGLALRGLSGMALMRRCVADVVGYYRGHVGEWDVVKEAVEPSVCREDLLRADPFFEKTDVDYIKEAFHVPHEANTAAVLIYNDYGMEYRHRGMDLRRRGVLQLSTKLKRRNVPVQGLGIQARLIAKFDSTKSFSGTFSVRSRHSACASQSRSWT